MVSQVILDEIEALGGIFCADREFEVQSIGEKEVILVIQPQQIRSHLVSLTVILDTKTYPISSPLLSVQVGLLGYSVAASRLHYSHVVLFIYYIQCAKLNRIELQNLNSQIEQEASKLKGEVMILSLVEWLVDNIVINFEDATSPLTESLREKDEGNDCTIVAQLDHIRSRTIYMKTLNQWFSELELHGVLIFYRRWIFLLVSGKKHSLQVKVTP